MICCKMTFTLWSLDINRIDYKSCIYPFFPQLPFYPLQTQFKFENNISERRSPQSSYSRPCSKFPNPFVPNKRIRVSRELSIKQPISIRESLGPDLNSKERFVLFKIPRWGSDLIQGQCAAEEYFLSDKYLTRVVGCVRAFTGSDLWYVTFAPALSNICRSPRYWHGG